MRNTFTQFGGGTTDPNAFQCNGEERDKKRNRVRKRAKEGMAENGRKKKIEK